MVHRMTVTTMMLLHTSLAHLETCPDDIHVLKDLPGYGWDNLDNSVRLAVFKNNFSVCEMTQDKTFRIPSNVFIHNRRDSSIEFTSKAFTSSDKYESATSQGINAEAGGGIGSFSISASFSYEHKQNKKQQASTSSVTLRNEYRYNLFTAIVDTYSEVSDILKKRIITIGKLYETDVVRANFMIEEFVRDYGTHLVTAVEFGAILFQDDKIDRETFQAQEEKGDSYTFGLKGSNPFASMSMSGHHESSQTKEKSYEKSKRGSAVFTHGGEVQTSLNVTNWLKSIQSQAVPINRNGIPIENIFNELSFPDVEPETLKKIRRKTEDIIRKFYSVNTHHGCMDPHSPNFDYKANFNDGSCGLPRTDFSFGGFFQTGETCRGSVYRANPLTGGYSCPDGYKATQLYEHSEQCCHRKCKDYFFWSKCWTECQTKSLSSSWCYSETKKSESGWAFGGFLGPLQDNPQTGKKECPIHYVKDSFYPFSICSAPFNELTRPNALVFGGIFSCEADNPYSGHSQNCPGNYSKILITVAEPHCAVYYCTQLVETLDTPPLIRPPFPDYSTVKWASLTHAKNRMEAETKSSSLTIYLVGGTACVLVVLVVIGLSVRAYDKKMEKRKAYTRMEEESEEISLLRPTGSNQDDTLRRRNSAGAV